MLWKVKKCTLAWVVRSPPRWDGAKLHLGPIQQGRPAGCMRRCAGRRKNSVRARRSCLWAAGQEETGQVVVEGKRDAPGDRCWGYKKSCHAHRGQDLRWIYYSRPSEMRSKVYLYCETTAPYPGSQTRVCALKYERNSENKYKWVSMYFQEIKSLLAKVFIERDIKGNFHYQFRDGCKYPLSSVFASISWK